jgi:hypothetical protein
VDLPVGLTTNNPYAIVGVIFIVSLLGWGSRGWLRDYMAERRTTGQAKYDLARLVEGYTAQKMSEYERELKTEREARFKDRHEYEERISGIESELRNLRSELLERDWDTQAAVGWALAQHEWIRTNVPDAKGIPIMPARVRKIIERGSARSAS